MEVGQFIESFMSFLKLRKGCAIYRKIDCSTVRLSTVLVLWTHEHFTIVLMAYLWQLGSRRPFGAASLFSTPLPPRRGVSGADPDVE